jgi:hypothetical protein
MLGGWAAATAALTILRQWPGKWSALAVSASASALLGAFVGAGEHSEGAYALIGVGVLGTAASMTFVIADPAPLPTDFSAGMAYLRRLLRMVIAKALLCATFATAGYICSDLAVVLYQKLLERTG